MASLGQTTQGRGRGSGWLTRRESPLARAVVESGGKTMRAGSPSRFKPVFVGRAAEMRQLQTAAEAAAGGQGCVVTVTGDPGIGKSRLLEEFAGKISSRARVLEGRCSYAEGAPPYYPWVQVIAGYVSAARPAPLRRVLGEHASVIAEVVQPVGEALGELAAPVPLEHPGSARFRFFQSVAAVLRRVAEERTLVVLLHDLHPREVGGRTLGERTATFQHPRPVADGTDELLQQTALADARIPGDSDHAALAARSDLCCSLQLAQFRRAAHEDGVEPEGGAGAHGPPASFYHGFPGTVPPPCAGPIPGPRS